MAAKTQGTWRVISEMGVAPLTNVDTTAAYTIGKSVKAIDIGATAYGEAEFIYWGGATSCAVGSVLQLVGDGTSALIAARAKGAVALAISAVDATTKFGWFQVRGKGVALCDTVASGAACYIDNTSGQVDDAAVAGDCIIGMHTASADATGTCLVQMVTRPATADYDNA